MKPTKAEIAAGAALLRGGGWLAGTATDFQDAVLQCCHWQTFPAGETISHGGDTSGGMFGIANGNFSAIPAVGSPDSPMIHVGSAPFWYGSNPVVSGMARTMSVGARTPCLVAMVPQHALNALFADNPQRWRFIAQSASEILTLAMFIATDLMIRDSQRRCIAVLLRAGGCRTAGTQPAVAFVTQDELAGMANMSRQTIGPILRGLADAGLATVGYRNITLHDPAALRAMIEA